MSYTFTAPQYKTTHPLSNHFAAKHDRTSTVRWLRLVGSLKSHVSFAKEPYKRDCILQKRPTILRSLIIVATPCMSTRNLIRCNTTQNIHCTCTKQALHIHFSTLQHNTPAIHLLYICCTSTLLQNNPAHVLCCFI